MSLTTPPLDPQQVEALIHAAPKPQGKVQDIGQLRKQLNQKLNAANSVMLELQRMMRRGQQLDRQSLDTTWDIIKDVQQLFLQTLYINLGTETQAAPRPTPKPAPTSCKAPPTQATAAQAAEASATAETEASATAEATTAETEAAETEETEVSATPAEETAAPAAPGQERRRMPRTAAVEASGLMPLRLFEMYKPLPVPEPPLLTVDLSDIEPLDCLYVGSVLGGAPQGAEPAQVGIIGHYYGRGTAYYLGFDVDRPLCTGLFGTPGSGKSYGRGVLLESYLQCGSGTHLDTGLLQPACVISLRVGEGPETPLDLLQSVFPNRDGQQVLDLYSVYGIKPAGLKKQAILCFAEDVAAYRAQYPYALVLPVKTAFRHLSSLGLKGLLGIKAEKTPLYAKELGKLLRVVIQQEIKTLAGLQAAVKKEGLPKGAQRVLEQRLDLLTEFVDELVELRELIRAGWIINIALSTKYCAPDQARLMAGLLLDIMVLGQGGQRCPLVVDLDEAHTLMDGGFLEEMIEQIMRRRRHLRASLLFCTHNPKTFSKEQLALFDCVGLCRNDDPDGLRHLQASIGTFDALTARDCASMKDGSMYLWCQRAHNFEDKGAIDGELVTLVQIRPRTSLHGGATRMAVGP